MRSCDDTHIRTCDRVLPAAKSEPGYKTAKRVWHTHRDGGQAEVIRGMGTDSWAGEDCKCNRPIATSLSLVSVFRFRPGTRARLSSEPPIVRQGRGEAVRSKN